VRIGFCVAAAAAAAVLAACEKRSDANDVELGRRAYAVNCIACHNADPAQDGAIGPAIAGSSLALVEARVLRAQYPPGYKPKRSTQLMPAQPFLAELAPKIAAYLESVPPAP
jgi:mono/diheme cytochrome c family protein